MIEKIYNKKAIRNKSVPRDIRKAALLAIKFGKNPEAIERANRIADEINLVSFYEQQVREHIVRPFELI